MGSRSIQYSNASLVLLVRVLCLLGIHLCITKFDPESWIYTDPQKIWFTEIDTALWCYFFRLPWKELFQPAIRLANETGFNVTKHFSKYICVRRAASGRSNKMEYPGSQIPYQTLRLNLSQTCSHVAVKCLTLIRITCRVPSGPTFPTFSKFCPHF